MDGPSDGIFEVIMSTFQEFDLNGDGLIECQELKDVLSIISPDWTNERVHHLFSLMDADGDTHISFEDFLKWAWVGDDASCISNLEALRAAPEVGKILPFEDSGCSPDWPRTLAGDSNTEPLTSREIELLPCELWRIVLELEPAHPNLARELMWTEGATARFQFLQACFHEQEQPDKPELKKSRQEQWGKLAERDQRDFLRVLSLSREDQGLFFTQIVEDDNHASPVFNDSTSSASPDRDGCARTSAGRGSSPLEGRTRSPTAASCRASAASGTRSGGSPAAAARGGAPSASSSVGAAARRRSPVSVVERNASRLMADRRPVAMQPAVIGRSLRVAASREEREAARRRLRELLVEHGVEEKFISGGGSCQFRALADQLYGNDARHAALRRRVCEHLRANPDRYCGFVPGAFEKYVVRMERLGTWGDNVSLQAACDMLGMRIFVLSDYPIEPFKVVTPVEQTSDRVLTLCFHAEVHYSSTRARSDSGDVRVRSSSGIRERRSAPK